MASQQQQLPLIKVAGVPEHFNTPWALAIEKGIFRKNGVEVEFIEQKLGTGALLTMVKNEEVDVIVALTEGLIADISKKGVSDVRLLGTYVESPLCWAISVGKNSNITSVEDLRGKVWEWESLDGLCAGWAERMGSAKGFILYRERIFCKYAALTKLYITTTPHHATTNNNNTQQQQHIDRKYLGLREGVNDGTCDVFMWETFMTKPYHDSGEVKRIGEITTPWPCFMMASRIPIMDKKEGPIKSMMEGIREACDLFHAEHETMPGRVAQQFGHRLEDSKEWYKGVRIVGTGDLSESALEKTLAILREVKVIEEGNNVTQDELYDTRFAHVRRDIKYMRLYNKPELVKSVDLCIDVLKITKDSRVLQIGSGLGGQARYLAGKIGCKVLAVDLQHDLTSTAQELTERCSLTNLVHHVAGDFLQCAQVIKPGGHFYAEDFYQKHTLTPDEKTILQDDVYCSYLPSLQRYTLDVSRAGFEVEKAEELTENWTAYAKQRIENFEKKQLGPIIGDETYPYLVQLRFRVL